MASCNTRQFIKDSLYRVVYSVKTVKLVFYYDQDKTFSPRDYLTPRIIAYLKIFCPESHWIGDNRKRSYQSINADKKSQESVFSIAFCNQSGDR